MGDITSSYSPFSDDEMMAIEQYVNNGKPGLINIKDEHITKWFDLYMSGKTYKEISKLEGVPVDEILYISKEFDWHGKKMVHFGDLIEGMTGKLTQIKLETTNTLNTTISAMNKYFGNKFNSYLQTNDNAVMEDIDTKLLVQYYKAVDTLSKLTAPVKTLDNDSPATPPVNINLNGETTIQSDGQDIKITKENAGDVLKMLAGAKKVREKT